MKGYSLIGVDEVGRGAWAGPLLVVAARQTGTMPEGLRDSKKLTRKQRESIFNILIANFQFGEGWVQPSEIDQLGLTDAMRLAVSRALKALNTDVTNEIIMDGTINYCDDSFTNVKCIARADDTHPIVSAASIYAKVLRDAKMTELALQYPYYGFEKHVGYGTKIHLDAIAKIGVCELHRLSYKPLKAFI